MQGKNGQRGTSNTQRPLPLRPAATVLLTVSPSLLLLCACLQFPASQLYLQLQYFRSLFDVERAIEGVHAENQRSQFGDSSTSATQGSSRVELHSDLCLLLFVRCLGKSDPRNSLPQLQAAVPGLHADVYKKMHGYMVAVLRQSSYYWLSPAIFDTKVATKR